MQNSCSTVFTSILVSFALVSSFFSAAQAQGKGSTRQKLVFSPDISVGRVYSLSAGWNPDNVNPLAPFVAVAQGTVYVPAGRPVIIELNDFFNTHPHALSRLPDGVVGMLDFRGADIEDKAIDILSKQNNMNGVKRINLLDTEVGDGCICALVRFKNLTGLSLQSTNLKGTTLGALTGLPRLSTLHIGCNELKPVAFDHVSKIKTLVHLNVARTKMDDRSAVKLSRLARLQNVELNDNVNFSDKGLAAFKECKSINHFDLRNTAVTVAGVRSLKSPVLDSVALSKNQFGPVVERKLAADLSPVNVTFEDRPKLRQVELFSPLK
jgi:hypothetical protein